MGSQLGRWPPSISSPPHEISLLTLKCPCPSRLDYGEPSHRANIRSRVQGQTLLIAIYYCTSKAPPQKKLYFFRWSHFVPTMMMLSIVSCTIRNKYYLLTSYWAPLFCPSFYRVLVFGRDSPVVPCSCSSTLDSVRRRSRPPPALPLHLVHDHDHDRDSDRVYHAHLPHDRVQTETGSEHQASHCDCDSYSGPDLGGQTTTIRGVACCPKTRALQASFLSILAVKGEEEINLECGCLFIL